MSDWAEMQAEMLLPYWNGVSGSVIDKRRQMIAEALWQAYENGIKEGELRYLRPLTKPTVTT